MDNNKGIHMFFKPSTFMDDDVVGAVTGGPLGVIIGALSLVGLVIGGRLVGTDTGFPVDAIGASVGADGVFVGRGLVVGAAVNIAAIPKFAHSSGTLGHWTYTKLGHAKSSVDALGHFNVLNAGKCDGHCGYDVSVMT